MDYAGSYRIIGRIQAVGNDEVLLGFNKIEPLPYGVWLSLNGVLGSGEYFKTKAEALSEMLRWLNYYDVSHGDPQIYFSPHGYKS